MNPDDYEFYSENDKQGIYHRGKTRRTLAKRKGDCKHIVDISTSLDHPSDSW